MQHLLHHGEIMDWLLFISQLPSTPSSLRVNVWRKLRAAGALGLQNGVWLLPDQPEQVNFLEELLGWIQSQWASGQVFQVSALNAEVERDIQARIQAERDEEYSEFLERAAEFLAEIEKESAKQKFTFAELEENEQDYQRLETWLKRIRKRDYIGGGKAREAGETFTTCRMALESFADEVYNRQTLDKPNDGTPENL